MASGWQPAKSNVGGNHWVVCDPMVKRLEVAAHNQAVTGGGERKDRVTVGVEVGVRLMSR